MTDDLRRSRPLRLAAELTGLDHTALRHSFDRTRVFVEMHHTFAENPDAGCLFQSLVDQLSRFCGSVALAGPQELTHVSLARDRALRGSTPRVRRSRPHDRHTADLHLKVGSAPRAEHEIGVYSDRWAGCFLSVTGFRDPEPSSEVNPVGALAAASVAAGEAFLRLTGIERISRAFEISAWTGESGPLETVDRGPALGDMPPIDVLLLGCGNVTNAWVKAIRELRLTGHLRAVDRQSLGDENLGTYALARQDMVGKPKTLLVADYLAPRVDVVRHDEELHLFVPRVTEWGLPLPPLEVNGLDNVEARHLAQRMWPETLIDMAAGGTTSQVIVHRRGRDGQCLLGAYERAPEEGSYEQRVADLTGLRPDRVLRDYTTPITPEDVAAAPPHHRARLEAARRSGLLICGYISQASLSGGAAAGSFAAAAPFVAALAGARAAAITVRTLTADNQPEAHRWQYSFLSNRSSSASPSCPSTCECQLGRSPQSA